MLRLINVLPHKAFDFLASKPIGQLEIIDYENQIPIKKDRVFHNVKSLCIYGNFTRDSIMQNFIHLQSLFLCNTSNDFQIYNLRKYRNLYGIREFTFITCAVHYINGKDLEFLAECERLELILTHYNSELEFEQFDLLNSLKELKIGAGFVSELDFNDLPKELDLLTLAVPGEEVQYAKQMAVRGGYGRAKKTVIENYHDLLRGLENKVGNSIWGT